MSSCYTLGNGGEKQLNRAGVQMRAGLVRDPFLTTTHTASGRLLGMGVKTLKLLYLNNYSIFLFLSGCAGFLSVVARRVYSLVSACGLPIAIVSLVAERGLWSTWTSVVEAQGVSSCGSGL